jgi:hypothetical protein
VIIQHPTKKRSLTNMSLPVMVHGLLLRLSGKPTVITKQNLAQLNIQSARHLFGGGAFFACSVVRVSPLLVQFGLEATLFFQNDKARLSFLFQRF